MCEKALQDILLEIAGFSPEQLSSATDPSLLACCRALTAVCTTAERGQEHVFLASILTCLEQLVGSTSLRPSSRGDLGVITSFAKVTEAVDRLLLFLRALKDRCAAALRLGTELLGPTSSGDCLQSLTKQWEERIGLHLSSFLPQPSDGALSVWGKTHCLLLVATSCFSMSCCARRILGVLHEDQSWLCLSPLTPALEQLLPRTAQSLPLVVEELSEADMQCLVCSCSNKLVCVESQQTKVLMGSAYLTDMLEVSLSVCVADQFPVSILQDLLHSILLSVQTYTCRLIQVTGRVPHSAPLNAWYVVISSLNHLYTRLSDFCSWPHLPDSIEDLPKLCQWLSLQCEAVVDRTVAYHCQLCSSSLLHDADSHDWHSNKPFFEGGRVSFPIQAWHLHLKALLHDLTSYTSDAYPARVTSAVMLSSLTTMTNYYVQLKPSPPRLQQYKADIKAILVVVASLLPSLYPWDDSSPDLKLTHSCCSSLTHALSAAGDITAAPGSWQHCVDLAHFGLYPAQHESSVSQLVSLVSLHHNQWGLLVERESQLAVELCRHGLLSSCAHILTHCHYQPAALAQVFSCLNVRLTQGDSISSAGLSWLRKFLRPLLQRPVLDAAVRFTVSMIHHSQQPITAPLQPVVVPVLVDLLNQLQNALTVLEPPVRILLFQLSSGPAHDGSVPHLLGMLLDGALSLPDWVQGKVWPPVGQWWELFSQLLALMCGREECSTPGDLGQFRACVQTDEVQQKLSDVSTALSAAKGEGNSPQVMACKDRDVQSLLHSTAAEVIRSEETGREAMTEVLHWVTANQTMLMELLSGVKREGGEEEEVIRLVAPHPVQELFDPVDTCCSLGTKQFDHQHLLQHVQIT